MKTKKTIREFICYAVLICLSFSNQVTIAQDEIHLWEKEPYGNMEPSSEIIDLRSEYAKHFRNETGKITALISAGPVNYLEDGRWKTIYHTIIPHTNGFENTANSHKTYYPKYANGSITTVLKDGSVIKDMREMRMYYLAEGKELQAAAISGVEGKADFNELHYANAYGNGIDLRLTQHTTFRKMDYIIQNKAALGSLPKEAEYLVFEEKAELPAGWKASIVENQINIYNQQGVLVAVFGKPLFYDSPEHGQDESGNHIHKHSNELVGNYEIEQHQRLLTIRTLVPVNWLRKDLAFPVFIDPTINLYPDNTARWTGHHRTDGGTNCHSPGCAAYTSTNINESVQNDFWAGRYDATMVYNGWVKFNITDIPDDACINSAEFRYYVSNNSSASPGCVISTYFRHLADDPSVNDFSVAANNQARLADIRNGNIYGDFNTAVLVAGTGWRTVNLTANMADLQSQLVPNWFAVGLHTYGGASNHLTCRNQILGYGSSNRPMLVVNYDPPVGTEDITICPEDLPYTWHGQTINAGGNGVATAIVQSTTGCDVEVTLNLTVHPATTPLTEDITICDSDLPYTWHGQTINAGGTGIATHTTQNSNGCDVLTTLNLTVNPTTHLTDDITICDSELPFSWNGQTITTGGNGAATHTTQGTNGCDIITTLNLTVNATQHLTDDVSICEADLPYTWNGQTINAGGNNVATHVTQGQNGCDIITTLNLNVYPPISASFTAQAEVCLPSSVTVTSSSVSQGGSCAWEINGVPVTGDCSGVSTTVTQSGCYDINLTVTDVNGCIFSTSQNDAFCIEESPVASFELQNQTNENAQTNNLSSNAGSYTWILPNGTTTSDFEPTVLFPNEAGTYSITLYAYNSDGCYDSTTVTVEIIYDIVIPNVITVNNDGVNDFFVLQEMLPNTQLLILNRWGNVVYSSANYDNSWNGRDMNGNYVTEGVYTYLVTVPDGTKHHGFVHVVR